RGRVLLAVVFQALSASHIDSAIATAARDIQRFDGYRSNERGEQYPAQADDDGQRAREQRLGRKIAVADRQSRYEREIDRLVQRPAFNETDHHAERDDNREQSRQNRPYHAQPEKQSGGEVASH